MNDIDYMKLAIQQAKIAYEKSEVPIGAIVIKDSNVISSAYNMREETNNPSDHAEFLAIKKASEILGRWRLNNCSIYTTLEPCIMCAGLMHQARIKRCVYGASDKKAGALGSLYNIHCDSRLNHTFEVVGGVEEETCSQLLKDFFKARRKNVSKSQNK